MVYQSLRFGKYPHGVLVFLPAIGRLSKKAALGELEWSRALDEQYELGGTCLLVNHTQN
ncbi:Uncharacterised protein [Streptococcus pneumoniae]|nr:Uncharacterised protein [Streptococcus pneumoniae]CIV95297.1 Uncharacterised protein [Streptococcus pneumoniae]